MITLESILEDIEKKSQELDVEYIMDSGYEMCKDYTSEHRVAKVEDYMEIDLWKFIKCFIYARSKGSVSIDGATKLAEVFEKLFDDLDYYDFSYAFSSIVFFVNHEKSDDLLDYITEPDDKRAASFLESIPDEDMPLEQVTCGDVADSTLHECLQFVRELEQAKGGYSFVHYFIDTDFRLSLDTFFMMLQYKCLIDKQENVIKVEGEKRSCSKKVLKRAAHDYYRTVFSLKEIKSHHDVVSNFVDQEERNKAEYDRVRRRKLYQYKQAVMLLNEANRQEEVTNAREILKRIPDEDIKRKVLEWIQQKNAQVYQNLESRYEELSSNSINQYIAVLKKHQINMDPTKVTSIMHNTLEQLDEILTKLSIGSYSLDQITKILQVTDLPTCQKVRKYVDLGFISARVLPENIDLFIVGGEKLQRLEDSCNLLHQYGVNPKLFVHASNILWDDEDTFKSNIEFLSNYNLLRVIRTTTEFDFLLDKSMVEKIDQFVELGYYNYLEQDLGLLNCKKERIQRLQLLKSMNIPIEDIETLYEVLSNNKFIVRDDKIEGYLLDVIPYKRPIDINISLGELENRSNDRIALSIGSSIISIPKIKRLVSQNMPIGEAIFYGGKYSEEEYNQIMQTLSSYSRR